MRILAANDDAALIIHRFLPKTGRVASRDYGLIGFDDEPQVRTLGISSIYPAFGSLGRQTVSLALRNAVIKLPPALFLRKSTLAKSE